jgi:hypothetical protein
MLSPYHLSTLSDGILRECLDMLNEARLSFKDHVASDSKVHHITMVVQPQVKTLRAFFSQLLSVIKLLWTRSQIHICVC